MLLNKVDSDSYLLSFLESSDTLDLASSDIVDIVSSPKNEENNSLSEDNYTVCELRGIKVTPSYLEFSAVFGSGSFTKDVSIRNISEKSIEFFIKQPTSISFRITDVGTKISLAPGLAVKKSVIFHYRPDTHLSSSFTIRMKDAAIQIPVFFTKVHTKFSVTPSMLHFGNVNIGSQRISKLVKMKNLAPFAAQYKVVVGPNENYIQVTPNNGFLGPNETHILDVQFSPTAPGNLHHEISVMPPVSKAHGDWRQKSDLFCRIILEANMIVPFLVAIHRNTTGDFTLCDFPLTFPGTFCYDTVTVFNTSAKHATYVVMAEMVNYTLIELRKARKRNSSYKMFSVHPTEGRIGPFENASLKITYNPIIENPDRGWKCEGNNGLQNSHLCFFKIVMIEVTDQFDSKDYSNTIQHEDEAAMQSRPTNRNYSFCYGNDSLVNEGFRLCLHGLYTPAVLVVEPDSLVFKDLLLGTEAKREVNVINRSSMKLGYRAVVQSYVRILPDILFLEPGKTVQIETTVCAHAIGKFKRVVTLEFLSMENATDSTGLKVIGETKLNIQGYVKAKVKKLIPKLNFGITPTITHEVGFLSEEVTFGSNVQMPSKSIVPVKGHLPRMHKESDVVAFPNDMPRSLHPHYPDKVFRTIFTGRERYAPPMNSIFTYTKEEKLLLNKHNEFWLNYMREVVKPFKKKQIEVTDHRGYGIKDLRRLNAPEPVSYPPFTIKRSQKLQKFETTTLSPLELFNIKVKPKVLDFFMIAEKTDCEEWIYVENTNNFPVSVHLISGDLCLKVNGDDHLVIHSYDKGKFSIVLNCDMIGNFSGDLRYIINGNHMFDMTVTAEIVEKYLSINPVEARIIETKNNPFFMWCDYITLINELTSDTAFSWNSKSFRSFDIEPKSGIVPGMGKLNCAITYQPNSVLELTSRMHLMIEKDQIETMKCVVGLGNSDILFINPVLNLGPIPLNLKVVAKAVLFNTGHRKVPFCVSPNNQLITGVTVTPTDGFLEPRGSVIFTFTFTVLRIGSIDFKFSVNSELNSVSLRVMGQVVFPKVAIVTDKIHFLRIPCYTHTKCMLTAQNMSAALVTLSFLFDEYYHFKVSLSPEYLDSKDIDGFSLMPGASQNFFLHFLPTDLTTHKFYLPVVINNIIGPPDINDLKTYLPSYFIDENQGVDRKTFDAVGNLPTIIVLCTVAAPYLNFSKILVKFVDYDGEDKISVTNPLKVIAYVGLKRMMMNDAKSCFSIKCSTEPIFIFKKEEVYIYEIRPKKSLYLHVAFNSAESGFYEEDLLVYYTRESFDVLSFSDFQLYTHLKLQGSSRSSLSVSESCIYFPPIPLGVEVLRKFTITADNYYQDEELEVDDIIHQTLRVTYNDGNIIYAKKKCVLQINVSFKSHETISLKTQLIFKDFTGGQVTITVLATADNCLITTHSFLTKKFKSQTENSFDTKSDSSQYNQVEFINRLTASLKLSTEIVHQSNVPVRRAFLSQSSLMESSSHSNTTILKSHSPLTMTKITKYQKMQWQSVYEFPEEEAGEEYLHMKQTLTAVERYIFGQIFNCSYYWKIGENIKWSSAFKPADQGPALKNENMIKSVVELLERFCGKDIHIVLPHINIPFPKDDESRVMKVISLWENVLNFLAKLGACVNHLEPEYLLDTYDYEIYCRKRNQIDPVVNESSKVKYETLTDRMNMSLSKEEFERRVTQSWLDLILQVYKVCVLYSVKYIPFEDEKQSSKHLLKDKKSSQNIKMRDSKALKFKLKLRDKSTSENILLLWLEHYYLKQRTVLWPNNPPADKTIDFFDCLSDSLVFAAVTSFYCPYISSMYFSEMFTNPKGRDQIYHNAICLLKAWNNIKLGIFAHASDLVDVNCIVYLMITVHLYKVLPTYVPEAVLNFGTPLTTSKELPIQITNSSSSPANYVIVMIGNPYRSFIVQHSASIINIKSKGKATINIQYISNKIVKETATILFCGSCVPPHFTSNKVFTLVGYAQELLISNVFTVKAPLNKIEDKVLQLNAPYGTSADEYEFDVWYSENKPSVDDISIVPWKEISTRKLPKIIHFPYSTMVIPGQGRKTNSFSLKICCFTPKQKDFYFILMSPSVGDFIIQITIKPKAAVMSEPIFLNFEDNIIDIARFSKEFSDSFVKFSQENSLNALIKIPFRNKDLWTSVMTMFSLTLDSNEISFWSSYLDTNIGLKLLQWMIGDEKSSWTNEISHIFHTNMKYTVACSNPSLIAPPSLFIPNVKMLGTLDFPVHGDKDELTSSDNKIKLSFTANHGSEIRVYKVIVQGEERLTLLERSKSKL